MKKKQQQQTPYELSLLLKEKGINKAFKKN